MSDALDKAATVLREATTVAIVCHVNPDPDALGSTLGLSNHLRGMGKTTICSFPNEPFELPRWVDELPGAEALVPPRDVPKEPPVVVTCDVASMDRLAMLAPNAVRAKHLICIDHHASNGSLPPGARFIDPSASATGALV